MIPIAEAIEIVERETASLGCEPISLTEAVGRILAEDILADGDLPPFDRSQMDGFAVKASDTKDAPVELKIAGESAAGHGWHHELKSGEAVRIMTGAPVPAGADSVQRMELAEEMGEAVRINERVEPWKFIVRQGDEVKKGDIVFTAGEPISENMVAGLAAFGYTKVKVAVRPRVSILSTGSEIVELDQTPGPDQIRNSNSVMLKVLAEKNSAVASILPIVGDNLQDLKNCIRNAAGLSGATNTKTADLIVITGGVSVGKYDLTKAALRELGAEIFFERVRLKPGKPTVFAKLGDTLVFGLPGNPVSAAVTYYLFVRMAILKMQSATETQLREGYAVAAQRTKGAKERDAYLPAILETDENGRLLATTLKWIGSSDFIGFARAKALIAVPKGKIFEKDDVVKILFL